MASTDIYLVFLGTSRQGSASIDGLLGKGVPASSIFATSRSTTGGGAKKLIAKGVTVLESEISDVGSMSKALKDSNASRVWFTTDFFNKAGNLQASL
jgi:hypothetical protein